MHTQTMCIAYMSPTTITTYLLTYSLTYLFITPTVRLPTRARARVSPSLSLSSYLSHYLPHYLSTYLLTYLPTRLPPIQMYRSGLAVVVVDLVQVLLKQFVEWCSACTSTSSSAGGGTSSSAGGGSGSNNVSSGVSYVASPCPWSNEMLALAPLLHALAHLLR